MRYWTWALVCGLTLSMVSCAATRDWVITQATKIAERAGEKALEKASDKLLPLIDEKVRAGIDANNDGLLESEELSTAMKTQFGQLASNLKTALTADTDEKLSERLKGALTQGDGLKGLLSIAVLWLLAKLGINVKNGKLSMGQLLARFRKKQPEEATVEL